MRRSQNFSSLTQLRHLAESPPLNPSESFHAHPYLILTWPGLITFLFGGLVSTNQLIIATDPIGSHRIISDWMGGMVGDDSDSWLDQRKRVKNPKNPMG